MTIFKKENGFKQFFALLVVVTLICPGVLSAKKIKHGAWITVVKQDDQSVDGELLKVSDSDILLMSNSETGITIPLDEITMIKYKKKGKFGTGLAIGIGISMLVGGILGASAPDDGGVGMAFIGSLFYGGIFGLPSGLLLGIATSQSSQKIYHFQHANEKEISMNIEKLKSLARF